MDVKDIIEKIKASLPFLNKGEDEDDDDATGEHEIDIEDDDEDAPKKTKNEDDEDDEDEEEVDEAAAKRSKLIKGVAGLVVVWVALDEFVLKEEPPPPAPVVRRVKKKRPQKKKPQATPVAEITAEPIQTPELWQRLHQLPRLSSNLHPSQLLNLLQSQLPPLILSLHLILLLREMDIELIRWVVLLVHLRKAIIKSIMLLIT